MQFLFPYFTSHLFVGDAAVDLLPFLRSDKYDLSDYWPGAIEAMQWQRKLYGLHTEVRPTLLYCNETLFAQAGLGVPTTAWTWPQLRAATKRLTDRQRPKPVYGFGLDVQVFFTLPWVWGNGGAMLSADRSESLVARPESQEALQWLRDLSLTQAFGLWEADFSRANDIDVVELFLEGRVAMSYGLWINESAFTQLLGRALQFNLAHGGATAGAAPVCQPFGNTHWCLSPEQERACAGRRLALPPLVDECGDPTPVPSRAAERVGVPPGTAIPGRRIRRPLWRRYDRCAGVCATAALTPEVV